MENKKILVVMGGPSDEAEVSRRSGQAVLTALQKKGYPAVGMEFIPAKFSAMVIKENPAIVFNMMHGAYGEDGRLAALLDCLGIPYTSAGVIASAVSLDKCVTKDILASNAIATPKSLSLFAYEDRTEQTKKILTDLTLPVVVKAAEEGSTIGVYFVEKEAEIPAALENAFKYGKRVLVEKFITGTEITAAVLGDNGQAEVLPLIEITTLSGRYDYESKYTHGASTHIIPARISEKAKARALENARRAFLACGLTGIARIDMLIDADDVPQVIDINSVPGMTELSLVPDAARAAGMSFIELCEKILKLAGYRP